MSHHAIYTGFYSDFDPDITFCDKQISNLVAGDFYTDLRGAYNYKDIQKIDCPTCRKISLVLMQEKTQEARDNYNYHKNIEKKVKEAWGLNKKKKSIKKNNNRIEALEL